MIRHTKHSPGLCCSGLERVRRKLPFAPVHDHAVAITGCRGNPLVRATAMHSKRWYSRTCTRVLGVSFVAWESQRHGHLRPNFRFLQQLSVWTECSYKVRLDG